jgi:hypothetical protein
LNLFPFVFFVYFVVSSFAAGDTHYVDLHSTNPVPPYTNWSTAATMIQDAVDAAVDGDTVLVSNGLYATGGRVDPDFELTNRLAISRPLAVRSVNGPAVTIIEGSGPNGSNAARCAYLGADCLLAGFTLTNGATLSSGDVQKEQRGGGVWCVSGAVVSNCSLSGNSAAEMGGGAYRGTLHDCKIEGNYAPDGGGAVYCRLHNCMLAGNEAGLYGGGTYGGQLSRCTLSGN